MADALQHQRGASNDSSRASVLPAKPWVCSRFITAAHYPPSLSSRSWCTSTDRGAVSQYGVCVPTELAPRCHGPFPEQITDFSNTARAEELLQPSHKSPHSKKREDKYRESSENNNGNDYGNYLMGFGRPQPAPAPWDVQLPSKTTSTSTLSFH